MQPINERLAQLPELLGYDSPAALAKAIGVDPNTLRKAMQGPSKPSFDTLEAILKKHRKLSPDWLLHGTGEMLRETGADKSTFLPGGTKTALGGNAHPRGQLTTLNIQLQDSEDYEAPEAIAATPKTDGEVISMLLGRLKDYQSRDAASAEEKGKLHRVISDQAGTIRFLQEQLSDAQAELRGKETGSQLDAPGTYTPLASIDTMQLVADAAVAVKKAFTPVPAKKIWTKPAGFLQAHRVHARMAVNARRKAWRKSGRHFPARIYSMFQDEQPTMQLMAA